MCATKHLTSSCSSERLDANHRRLAPGVACQSLSAGVETHDAPTP
jgi:hypothetical protein